MKILFSGHHNPHFHTITEYLERAIVAEGHELTVFEDRRHVIPGRLRKRSPFLNRFDLHLINRIFIARARRSRPEIAIVTGGHRIKAESVVTLKRMDIRCVLWTIDAPRIFAPITAVAPYYDHIFCQGTEAIELLEAAGIHGARWLPMACDPEFHHPVPCSEEDKKRYGSDVVFVGSYYPVRAALFERLVGFDLAIWGPGWDALPPSSPLRKHLRGRHTRPEEWLKIYSASKIVLSTHYQDPEGRFPVYQASPRVFEILACGAFQLCDDQYDVFRLFQDGRDLVRFTDAEDLVNKVTYYLSQDRERRKIATQGRQTVLSHHTYRHRIREVLRHICNPDES